MSGRGIFVNQNGTWKTVSIPSIRTDQQIPTNLSLTFAVAGGGGGGGGSDSQPGHAGYSGHLLRGAISINSSYSIQVYVGTGGSPGSSGGGAPGGSGGTNSLGYNGGRGSNAGPVPWSGAGGGGGAATVIRANGSNIIVAAGGGGGGGGAGGVVFGEQLLTSSEVYYVTIGAGGSPNSSGQDSYFGTTDKPSVTPGVSSPVYAGTYPVYPAFLNTYGVWYDTSFNSGGGSVNYYVNIPAAGQYTVACSADNAIQVSINGTSVASNANWGTTDYGTIRL